MNISFFLRDNNAKKPQRIWAFFRENIEAFKIDTGRKIEPAQWSNSKQRVLSTFKHAKEYNSFLKEYAEQIEKLVLQLKNKKVRLDKYKIQEEIDKFYKVNQVESAPGEIVDFISFIDDYIISKKNLNPSKLSICKQIRMNIILAFNLADRKDIIRYNTLGNREKAKYPLKPRRLLDFDDINLTFLEKFSEYLHVHQFKKTVDGVEVYMNYKRNYIGKQIKVLKQFVDLAQEKKYVEFFKITSIKAIAEDVDSVFTDYEELQRFLDLNLSENSTLEQVRDRYVLNSFLGFRYSDLNRLQQNDFSYQEIDGIKVLVYKGRNLKTDKKIEFAVHETAVRLLKKYKFTLPPMSENTYNESLKRIAEKAGLTQLIRIRETRGSEKIFRDVTKYKLISSHTGRRSFCTNFYNDGIAIQAIMSISGHKTEMEFLKYINKQARVNIKIVAAQVRNIKPLVFEDRKPISLQIC